MPHPLLPELESLASKTATDHGFELCGVQLLTHMIPMTVQVQIRQRGSSEISLDDCASFSRLFGEVLETSNMLNESYVLEISSPGIGEQLQSDRDFKTFKGFPVEVHYREFNDGERSQSGSLVERNQEHLQINIKGRLRSFPLDNVISVRLTSPAS
ncbi:MAG: ribosome maturation factor RimP [Prochlorococcus sp.]